MKTQRYAEPALLKRHENNPILSPKDIPYGCDKIYNPAACRLGDEICLVVRTDRKGRVPGQCLGLARSRDGVHFTVEKEPILVPASDEFDCLSDPRVTFIDGWYYLTYCSDPAGPGLREEGIYLGIARSKDLHRWERIYKSEPDNRNAVIFPRKIGGLYARLDRPFRRGYRREHGYDIWISWSPDMEFWGRHKLVLSHYEVDWGHHKIGPSAPPLWTSEGWLTIFHGAEVDPGDEGWLPWIGGSGPCKGKVYRAGAMLLDLEDPSKIIARRQEPLLSPSASYEMDPYYRPNVVFPCGIIENENGMLNIYYGASDTHIALATASKNDLLDWVKGKGL